MRINDETWADHVASCDLCRHTYGGNRENTDDPITINDRHVAADRARIRNEIEAGQTSLFPLKD